MSANAYRIDPQPEVASSGQRPSVSAPSQHPRRQAQGDAREPFALSAAGLLAETPAASVLRDLADRRATGRLRVEHEGVQAELWFRDGAIYTATAPGVRTRLGDRLVGAGHVDQRELDETLRRQRSLPESRRIGELLIERGLIDRETMRMFVREQVADSVAATLGWAQGSWRFEDDVEVGEDVPLNISVENLLMEGARRLQEWQVVQQRIGSLAAVVDFVPTGGQAELSLTADEWSMLTRIDGVASVAAIAASSGYGEFETARIVYGLLSAGIVRLVYRPEPPPAPAVNREELLREFAELGHEPEAAAPEPEPPPQRRQPPPPPRPQPPRPLQHRQPPPPAKRGGIFGRLRRG